TPVPACVDAAQDRAVSDGGRGVEASPYPPWEQARYQPCTRPPLVDLHTGLPYWLLRSGLIRTYPRLTGNLTTDVAIIGAGITGAMVAYELTRAGIDVVVLDADHVASGSSAATSGLLLYDTDS